MWALNFLFYFFSIGGKKSGLILPLLRPPFLKRQETLQAAEIPWLLIVCDLGWVAAGGGGGRGWKLCCITKTARKYWWNTKPLILSSESSMCTAVDFGTSAPPEKNKHRPLHLSLGRQTGLQATLGLSCCLHGVIPGHSIHWASRYLAWHTFNVPVENGYVFYSAVLSTPFVPSGACHSVKMLNLGLVPTSSSHVHLISCKQLGRKGPLFFSFPSPLCQSVSHCAMASWDGVAAGTGSTTPSLLLVLWKVFF